VIEPLPRRATARGRRHDGLAAGINFSLRSVALAGESYRRDALEQPLRSDEICKCSVVPAAGLDETGFVLITANDIACARRTPASFSQRRGGLGRVARLMANAAEHGRDPFTEASAPRNALLDQADFSRRGRSVEASRDSVRLKTDPERARHVRKRQRELVNSRGEWEAYPALVRQD